MTGRTPRPNRGGRPPKGGHRVTGRVTDRGLAALDLTAARQGKDRSDVIGDLAERLADTNGTTHPTHPTGPDATQATARDQASQNSHATENGDQP